jgi:putative acetyltransferase
MPVPPSYFDTYREYVIRTWTPQDRQAAITLIGTVLQEYGLSCEPDHTDRDALDVETHYWQTGGAFWVIERDQTLVGTAGYYPVPRGEGAVEIRKMYLLPQVRGQGLGRYLLKSLENEIWQRGFQHIWIETASVLKAACSLYESADYLPATGVETPRCDRIYVKKLQAS